MNLNPLIILLLICTAGCEPIGKQLALYLPERQGSDASRLNKAEDGKFIDPTTIGRNQDLPAEANMSIGAGEGSGHGDPTQNPDYQEMMQSTGDLGPDPGQQMGAFTGQSEYAAAMTIDESDTSETNNDLAGEYTMQVGEFAIPDTSEGTDVTSQYISQGGLTDPAMEAQINQDPTAQYLGKSPKPQDSPVSRQSGSKPNPTRAPRKNTNLPSTLRPKGQRGSSVSPSQTNSAPPVPRVSQNVKIGVPGRVNTSYAAFDAPVAVPMLLQDGTSMSFAINLQQTRPLPGNGTVYWVIHSPRDGFSRFALPVQGGQLPPRLQGVVPQFRPNSGPFQTFLVLVNPSSEVKYLTNAVEIPWTP